MKGVRLADFKLTFDNGAVAYTDIDGCDTAEDAGEALTNQAVENRGWVTLGSCYFHRTHLVLIEEHDAPDEDAA